MYIDSHSREYLGHDNSECMHTGEQISYCELIS